MPVAHWQDDRPPRVRRATFTLMPAASTSVASVQVPGFEDMGLLTRDGRLVYGFCSSGQCFAFGFLQIPPHGGHPCRSASGSPCRAHRGLAPPSRPGRPPRRAGTAPLYGASRHAWRTQKKAPRGAGLEITVTACLPKQAPEPDDDMRLCKNQRGSVSGWRL